MEPFVDYSKLPAYIQRFVQEPSAIFVLFEFLTREFQLSTMQLLCRDMYYKKVPIAYKFAFFVSKANNEQIFVNMGRNMNRKTHKYLGKIPMILNIPPKKHTIPDKEAVDSVLMITDDKNIDKKASQEAGKVKGWLFGEFLIESRVPDGRCVFFAYDQSITLLRYYSNGKVLNYGPQLLCDFE